MKRKAKCPGCGTPQIVGETCGNCGAFVGRADITPPEASQATLAAATPQPDNAPKIAPVRKGRVLPRRKAEDLASRDEPADIRQIMSDSLVMFRDNAAVLYSIMLTGLLASGVISWAALKLMVWTGIGGVYVLVATAIVLLSMLSLTVSAMMFRLEDSGIGIPGALMLSLRRSRHIIAASAAYAFMVAGGLMLLIVPGILAAVVYFPAQFLGALYSAGPVAALRESTRYTSGLIFDLLVKLLVIACMFMASAIVPVIGQLVFLPYAVVFMYRLFDDLRQVMRGRVASSTPLRVPFMAATVGNAALMVCLVLALGMISNELKRSEIPVGKVVRKMPASAKARAKKDIKTDAIAFSDLKLDTLEYDPAQEIHVQYVLADDVKSDAWIGIVPTNVWHGNEEENQRNTMLRQFITGPEKGELVFNAPTEPGDYDFRLNSSDTDGFEIASVTFIVRGPSSGDLIAQAISPEMKLRQSPGEIQPSRRPGMQPEPVMTGLAMKAKGNATEPPPASGPIVKDVFVNIVAVNYSGLIRINGFDYYKIPGGRDRKNTHTGFVNLSRGINRVRAEYKRLPDAYNSVITIKLYTTDWNTGGELIYGRYEINGPSGEKDFELEIK